MLASAFLPTREAKCACAVPIIPIRHICSAGKKSRTILLVIEDPASGIRARRIELQPVDLDRLTLLGQRFDGGRAIGRVDSPEDADA